MLRPLLRLWFLEKNNIQEEVVRVKNNLLKYFITQFWKLHVFSLTVLHSRLQKIEDAYGKGFYMYIASEIHVNHVIEKLLLPSF